MAVSVFDFRSYKQYLNERIRSSPRHGHGMRSQLAEAMNCNTGYVSQVLRGTAHLSLEQAEAANPFLGHTEEESEFFLLLLQHERAGTRALKRRFQDQLDRMIERRLNLKHRLDVKKTLSVEDQAKYYSAWYFAAVHMMVTVPGLQTKEEISRYLGMPLAKVSRILEFLVSIGLIVEEHGRYRGGTTRIHLGSDSPMIAKHHSNWRMRAIESLDRDPEDDLHYSSVVSVSDHDVTRIKGLMVEFIQQVKAIVKDSKEEGVQCFALDFFKV